MSVGNSVRKIAAKLNVGLNVCKFMGGYKPNPARMVLDGLRYKDIPQHSDGRTQIEKFYFIFPKLDVDKKTKIIEPEKNIKINFELPVKSPGIPALELPFQIEKEINEPGKVISKKAVHMIRVRRRKMRIHKRKKYLRKFGAELFKKRLKKSMEKEAAFQNQLREILKENDTFSAKNYVNDLLEKSNWVKPVYRVKGMLAPQWVIKNYLEEKEEKRIVLERIQECERKK